MCVCVEPWLSASGSAGSLSLLCICIPVCMWHNTVVPVPPLAEPQEEPGTGSCCVRFLSYSVSMYVDVER